MPQTDFSKTIKKTLAQRASYICSHPGCRALTIALADGDGARAVYKGRAVHICAPAEGGPRYDVRMTGNQRKAIENAIFLCSSCANLVNRNKGADYPAALLHAWKEQHKKWVRDHLNLRRSGAAQSRPAAALVLQAARLAIKAAHRLQSE